MGVDCCSLSLEARLQVRAFEMREREPLGGPWCGPAAFLQRRCRVSGPFERGLTLIYMGPGHWWMLPPVARGRTGRDFLYENGANPPHRATIASADAIAPGTHSISRFRTATPFEPGESAADAVSAGTSAMLLMIQQHRQLWLCLAPSS
jgi:hypothetical protein